MKILSVEIPYTELSCMWERVSKSVDTVSEYNTVILTVHCWNFQYMKISSLVCTCAYHCF